jgi:tight adherence protein B
VSSASALRTCATLVLVCSTAALLVLVVDSSRRVPVLDRYRSALRAHFDFLRVAFRPDVWISAQAAAVVILTVCAWLARTPAPLVLAAFVVVIPARLLARACVARVARIEAQLDNWLTMLASTIRTTPSLGEALASTVPLTLPPLSEEIDLALREYHLGIALDDALASIDARIGSRTFSAAVLTLRVARAAGGDLSQCLEASAATLREMARLDAVVRTKTAEGKAQATVISALPWVIVPALHWVDPSFLAPLATSTSGHVIIGMALCMWLCAVLLAMRIVQVDI